MLKRLGIENQLFLLTILFLFTVENLFSSYTLAATVQAPASQSVGSDSQSIAPSSIPDEAASPYAASSGSQPTLQTSYKKYSLCRYGGHYILCEPYTVQNGDWIYKIFRSKGEIAKEDFGLFLKIFKDINPGIKDMNAIKKDQCITIPLKKSNKNDFIESQPGVVELPIITLSQLHDKLRKSTKSKDEALSSIADTTAVIMQDRAAAASAITSDSQKPSYSTTNSEKTPAEIPIRQLKQIAMMNSGQLMTKGKYYFPRDNKEDLVIDVAFNPLINFKNGSRILFVPEKNTFEEAADTIRLFWRDLKIMEFGEVTASLNGPLLESSILSDRSLYYAPLTMQQPDLMTASTVEPLEQAYVPIKTTIPHDHKAAVKKMLETVEYQYTPEKEISVSVGTISVRTTPGLISRDGRPDILLVFGDIYGSAFEALEGMKYGDVISISPLLPIMDVARELFSALGASTTENPSFVNPANGKTVLIDGVHVKNGYKEMFITEQPMLPKESFQYLTEKKISILRVDNPL